jgi:hypothetical protein
MFQIGLSDNLNFTNLVEASDNASSILVAEWFLQFAVFSHSENAN